MATDKPRAYVGRDKVIIEYRTKQVDPPSGEYVDIMRTCTMTIEEAEAVGRDMIAALEIAKANREDYREKRRAELKAELAELEA